jgi:hypothetical protein
MEVRMDRREVPCHLHYSCNPFARSGPACTIAIKSVLIEELRDGDAPYTHVLALTFNADVDVDKAEAKIVGRDEVL